MFHAATRDAVSAPQSPPPRPAPIAMVAAATQRHMRSMLRTAPAGATNACMHAGVPEAIGVHIPAAATVNSLRYLEALWAACQDRIATRRTSAPAAYPHTAAAPGAPAAPGALADGVHPPPPQPHIPPDQSFLVLRQREVKSLAEVEEAGGHDAVIVACGAAAAALPEVPQSLSDHMDLSHVRPSRVAMHGSDCSRMAPQACRNCDMPIGRRPVFACAWWHPSVPDGAGVLPRSCTFARDGIIGGIMRDGSRLH